MTNKTAYADQLRKFRAWLDVSAIGRAIRGFLPTFVDGDSSKLELVLTDDLQPRTDGKTIWVSLLPYFLNDVYSTADWLIALRVATAHEAQHVNSSNFEDIEKIKKWYGKYLNDNFQLDESIGQTVAKDMLNIVEDGRIEAIAVKRRPGMTVPFLFVNDLIREGATIKNKADNEADEFNDFMGQILSYAKTGLYAPGIKVYQNTELEINFLAIRNLIDDGVNARSSASCRETVELMLSEAAPYIASLISNSEELQNELRQDNSQPEYTSNNENQFNDGNGQGNNAESGNNSSGQKSSNQTGENQNGNPLRQNSPCKKSKDEGKQKSSETGAQNTKQQESGSQGNSGAGNCTGTSQSKGENKADGSQSKGNSSTNNSQSQGNSSTENTSDSQGTNYGFGNADEQSIPLSKERLDEVRRLVSSEIAAINKSQQAENKADDQLDEKAIKEIRSSYLGKTGELKIYSPTIFHSNPLPVELNMQALVLQREIKKIIQSKQAQQNNLSRGLLDVKSLWKAGMADEKLFYRKRNPDKASCVFYFLLDNSSSMNEIAFINNGKKLCKFEAARSAAAIIEQASISLIPCKIALFNTGRNPVHAVIRNFDDKSKTNYSWNSLADIGTGGCNKDSVHIRIASKELMRRVEKKKVLFVLSDGLPSNYGCSCEAKVEVREAVNYARRNGIIVIPIMFGDEEFLAYSANDYKQMYEKNIVACLPQQITSRLIQLFRTVLTK